MWKLVFSIAALVAAMVAVGDAAAAATAAPATTAKPDANQVAKAKIQELLQVMETLSRQLMQQQLFVEERIRSEGMSGFKSVHHTHDGTDPMFGETHVGQSPLNIYDRFTMERSLGLSGFTAVMNGVDFKKVYNGNHGLVKPARSKTFHAVEDIPFPRVPSAVTRKGTVQEQIDEMRLWFKAFKEQDHSQRDYRNFFKPNLCYLEGGWTLTGRTMNEPPTSEKHITEANNWFDRTDLARYQSYTGDTNAYESFEYLPVVMYNFTDGVPRFAQFQVRTVCHPISEDIPLAYFQVQEDLAPRISHRLKWDQVQDATLARFKLNEFGTDRTTKYTLLDKLMGQIPGANNYGVNITDDSFGMMHYDIANPSADTPLNAGHYNRWYKLKEKGAMGLTVNHRGFKDENLWVAMTTQDNIMPLDVSRRVGGQM